MTQRIFCKCKRDVRREREHLIIFTAHLIVSHYSNAEIKPIKHCINDFWREKKKDGGREKLRCWAVHGQCYREEEYILPDWKLNNFSHCPISEVISLLNRGNLQSMKTPNLISGGRRDVISRNYGFSVIPTIHSPFPLMNFSSCRKISRSLVSRPSFCWRFVFEKYISVGRNGGGYL